jgi:hypothetical protein
MINLKRKPKNTVAAYFVNYATNSPNNKIKNHLSYGKIKLPLRSLTLHTK